MTSPGARVTSVSLSPAHDFSKDPQRSVRLLEGLGVEGDTHCGTTVQHRSHVARNPGYPNLRQVHLLQSELLDELARTGHVVNAGEMGENVTTAGVDLLSLPTDTVLRLGDRAEVRLTGLRNPCRQIDDLQPGLLKQVLGKDEDGHIVRRAGVMAVVRRSGEVRAGDAITVVLPPTPHRPLDRV